MRRSVSMRALVIGALGLALVLAFVVAPRASSAPDGLERVAADHGIDAGARAHPLAGAPLADYDAGTGGPTLRTGLAGAAGIAACFAIAAALAAVQRRRTPRREHERAVVASPGTFDTAP